MCTGSLILAAAGLLDGRRATSHWLAMDELGGLGAVAVRERVVFDGKLVTAAGVSAGIDMALALAARSPASRSRRRSSSASSTTRSRRSTPARPDKAPAGSWRCCAANSRFVTGEPEPAATPKAAPGKHGGRPRRRAEAAR